MPKKAKTVTGIQNKTKTEINYKKKQKVKKN